MYDIFVWYFILIGIDLCSAWNPVCIGMVYGVIGKVKVHPGKMNTMADPEIFRRGTLKSCFSDSLDNRITIECTFKLIKVVLVMTYNNV